MPEERSVDIDYEYQFKMAEALFKDFLVKYLEYLKFKFKKD